MTATRRSRSLTVRAALPLAAAALLAGCGSNFNAPTDQVYTPAQGVNDRSSTVDVLNALIVAEEDGSGRFIAGLSNNDTANEAALTNIVPAEPDAAVQFSLTGSAELAPGGFVQLADPDAAFVQATGEDVQISGYVRLTMSFTQGEDVTLNVPVVRPGEDFAGVALSPAEG